MEVNDRQKTVCAIGAFGLFFRFLLVVLVAILSGGILFPWMEVWLVKYICDKTTVDGCKINYTATGTELFVELLVIILLSIVTLGIFVFWVPSRILKFHISRVHIEKDMSNYKNIAE